MFHTVEPVPEARSLSLPECFIIFINTIISKTMSCKDELWFYALKI